MTDEGAHYWAFLSYSHADQAIATRLHKALEGYTLPAAVRKTHRLPRRLIPVFLDLEELEAASALSARLEQALDRSRWLLVLCTPAAAKSRYVNEEIEYFIGKHGAKRVLCVLAAGEPAESFPPAIKALEHEPLAADLRKDFDLGVLRVIAAMAMVGFTDLRNREAQRRKRQRLAATAIVGGVALGGLAYWDLFHREHVDYYTNYVRRHGIWEGVDKLGADEASHRNATYRFVRNGRLHPPRRVEYVNGNGHCPGQGLIGPLGTTSERQFSAEQGHYCAVRFDYRENGDLAREDWLNNHGRTLDSLTYTEDGLAQFTLRGFASAETSSGIYYVQSTRDEHGFDARVRFLHSLGAPRQNEDLHEFGWTLSHDDAGRVTRRCVVDDKGDEAGPVTLYRYDEHGLLVEERHTDLKGQLQISRDGFARRLLSYDARGNPVVERFLLPDGKEAFGVTGTTLFDFYAPGAPAVAYSWDDRGNRAEWRSVDGAGKLVDTQLGFAVARSAYDERGNEVRMEFFDAKLQPSTLALEGVAAIAFKYNANGDRVEIRNYGVDGKPAAVPWGAAITRTSFDDETRRYRECWFDANDQPMITRYGACLEWLFDERDATIGLEFYGLDGKLRARADTGGAGVRWTRDERGNLLSVSHFGARREPIISRHTGVAGSERTFDDNGNLTEIRTYDISHRLLRSKDGYAISRMKYDRFGQRIEEDYFDERQLPTRHKDGYFGVRLRYDERGRVIRREYLDASGGLMKLPSSGAYGTRYEFDAAGRTATDIFLAKDGSDDGRLERKYDERGREIEDRFLVDRGGQLAANPATGCALERFAFDLYSRIVEKRCLDAREQLVNRKDGAWALEKITPDISNVDKEEYFDANGKPVTPKKT